MLAEQSEMSSFNCPTSRLGGVYAVAALASLLRWLEKVRT